MKPAEEIVDAYFKRIGGAYTKESRQEAVDLLHDYGEQVLQECIKQADSLGWLSIEAIRDMKLL